MLEGPHACIAYGLWPKLAVEFHMQAYAYIYVIITPEAHSRVLLVAVQTPTAT